MDVKERIISDMQEAIKQKDSFKHDTLKRLNTVFEQVEVGEQVELNNERVYKIITSEIKKRKDAMAEHKQAQKQDLAQKDAKEIALFENYLPRQLSDEELEKALKKLLVEFSFFSMKEHNKALKEAKALFGASADVKRVSEMIRKLLS
ncbi:MULTISPECIES: GatB/YqeY domain-containing protein [unclassified Campylobacter]|uniref:GatB/YqeY domain-containing protein n=1 Tax=unclassified Campylobacter TaxID=2593542 RepID=UPI001237B913|nr:MULTISPECIES: GatB/YqeY domain-containing protein [unclassified Campylobacter]KAA6225017.1 GatB/YqeY domain-containing protein [Campylobacter sp. LR185c]KAA6225961.1 GatB/YqeY domain-containing protein [Campylobacter sp. LR286c]KAA6225976.1 GatB/YqeY domain-containing protein [Campylobacter sp. LR196d]KAA6230347.1 GatB/YqeY domain-containing protein [Campylobacter sp. LR264d]KAA6230971.1 GatB/YqeY domain-containing protein [Campylobacter sp. LR291e]